MIYANLTETKIPLKLKQIVVAAASGKDENGGRRKLVVAVTVWLC